MIMRRVFVATSLTMLCLAEGVAEAEGGAAPMEIVLTGDELDRYQIEAGMLVEVIYGKGARHGFSGAWEKLVVVRGVVDQVDWERRQLVVEREEDEAKETVAVDRIQTMTVIGRAELVDSLTIKIKKKHRPADIENEGLRFFAKVGAGTISGVASTVVGFVSLGGGLGGYFWGPAIGCSVGFPLGVTAVDPYDSYSWTLLAGVTPGLAGYYLIMTQQDGFGIGLLMYVVPVISSLIVSEQSRNPPQARRVSFELAPALNGGFSASAKLRF